MILLKDNKLIYVDTSEDTVSTIIAVKSLEELNKEKHNSFYTKDIEYTLGSPRYPDAERIYLFRMSKSPYKDDSGIGDGFNGAHQTKGQAISKMLEDGFRVYQDGIEIFPTNH